MDTVHQLYQIQTVEILGQNVITLNCLNCNRPIQIIHTGYKSLTEVLVSFDNSHNRCAFYRNKMLILPDAEHCKKTQTTYFFKNIKQRRYLKALKYGLKVTNYYKETSIVNYNIPKIIVPFDKFNRDICMSSLMENYNCEPCNLSYFEIDILNYVDNFDKIEMFMDNDYATYINFKIYDRYFHPLIDSIDDVCLTFQIKIVCHNN